MLAAAGVPDPVRDARVLLAHAAGAGAAGADDLSEADLARFNAALARRAAREPVSHITGRRAFWRHEFIVTPAVLDPRPDTETLVEAALAAPFERVLDLGTGSGAILLSLLADAPGATGLGTDISPDALAVAAANGERLGVSDRAAFTRADWFDGVTGAFDLVVSNPPYIAADEMPDLAPEVRDWEPRHALTDGGDGLWAYRAIAAGAPDHLRPGGRLAVETGATQGAAVSAILADRGFEQIRIRDDINGKNRVVIAVWPG